MFGRAALPGILVLKSDAHWTSHSVPGIRSQQRAVQSPKVPEICPRGSRGACISAFDVVNDGEVKVAGIEEEETGGEMI